MPRKIVRDIHKKDPTPLSLQAGIKVLPKKQPSHLLDISAFEKSKIVITGTNPSKICDLSEKKNDSVDAIDISKEKKVIFLSIDAARRFTLDRTGELIRLFAAGIFILFCINIANVGRNGWGAKNTVVEAASNGYNHLVQAGNQAKETDFTEAEHSFLEATNNFQNALNSISFLKANQNNFLTKEKTVQSLQGLLEAGKSISEAGADFSRGIENLRTFPDLFLQENKQAFATIGDKKKWDTSGPAKLSLTQKLHDDLEFLHKATGEIEVASDNLELVDESVLPENLKVKFKSLQEKVVTLKNFLHTTQEKIPILLELMGDRYLHRYLILLQNDTEARPTGGFIGSYLIVDINDGYIVNTEFHDVYETDGQLKEYIPAPEDIATITKDWRLRDSNYSPDFTISGEKAAWFLQKEKGPSVDTVIALNQNFIADLFEITGPITLEGLKAPLTKNNYQSVISYIVESKISGGADPKKILRSFIPAFQEKLFSSSSWGKVVFDLLSGARKGDLLFYSRNKEIQGFFDELGLSGRVLANAPDEDYLNVINTSIGGNKSDLYMKQHLEHTTLIDQSGALSDQIVVTRTHTWTQKSLDELRKTLKSFGYEALSDSVKFILGAGRNKSVVKIYVPAGSTLLAADGIPLKEVLTRQDIELNKTFFMFEMNIEPGTSKKITLNYRLPINLTLFPAATYKFFAQRQPGLTTSTFEKKIVLSPAVTLYKKYPETLIKDDTNAVNFSGKLEKNMYMSVLVGE